MTYPNAHALPLEKVNFEGIQKKNAEEVLVNSKMECKL